MKKQEKVNVYKNYYNHKDSSNVFFFALIAPYVISLIALLVVMIIAKGLSMDVKEVGNSLGFIITSSILTPLTFLGVFLIYNKTRKISYSACKLKFNLNITSILILLAISFVCVFGLQYLINGIDMGLEAIGYNITQISIPLNNGWWLILNIFVLAFLPAVCEELIFRGIILNGLRKNIKDIYAVLLSAFMFALMHGRIEQFIYPFILGLVFGWLVIKTKTILSSMIVHFVNNLLVIIISFIYEMTGFSFMPNITWLFWVLAFTLPIAVFGILFVIDKFYFKKKNDKEETIEESQKEVYERFPSIIFIISVVISVILIVINTVSGFAPAN